MDLTVVAIPGFFASMGYEAWWLDRRAKSEGPSAVDYERNDTLASLAMGTGSLFIPLATKKLAQNLAVGSGKWAKPLLGLAGAAALAAVVADAVGRANEQDSAQLPTRPDNSNTSDGPLGAANPAGTAGQSVAQPNRRWARRVRKLAGNSVVAAVAAGGVVAASTWAAQTSAQKLFKKRVLPDLGTGPLALGAAILGWDFVYYWNHRFMHETRFMWAIHSVHHSSERYNLSTALRQTWADSLGLFVPYGLLSLLGIRPELIETSRQINLIYQYWIHTDAIRTIGPLEEVLNTASHHRVHHGANKQYLDKNHGSILIIWDRLFGTFEREDEPVVYGLTTNINTFNPLRIAAHEHDQIRKDVAAADNWHDRLSYIFRGPGWAYSQHRGVAGGEDSPVEASAQLATTA
jgi:sterol desaturase/sphingolipid hydroxylase (fatty acid hydroxylase superfamily)